jgi:hypothetical protein
MRRADSERIHGQIIFLIVTDKLMPIAGIIDYLNISGIVWEQNFVYIDMNNLSFEIIAAKFEQLNSNYGYTIITNNDNYLVDTKTTNVLLGRLFPIGLKKVLVYKANEENNNFFVCAIHPFINDNSVDSDRKIMYSLAS